MKERYTKVMNSPPSVCRLVVFCAGQLYVRGDGTLANWWIANNAYNTGYGIDWLLNFDTPLGPWKVCYQTFEPMSYIDQGFKITVNDGNKAITKELNKKDF